MSTPPGPNLVKWYPPVDDNPTPAQTALHFRLLYNGTNDHDQAITTLKSQLSALDATVKATSTTINTGKTITITDIAGFASLAGVNDQTGNSAYTVQSGDNGALVALSNGAGVAVTLNSMVAAPYFVFLGNLGTGPITLNASSGAINGATTIAGDSAALAFFAGSNWWIWSILTPQGIAQVAHQWLDSYDATTGLFTQSQPTAADVLHAADVTAINTFTPTQKFTTGIQIGTAPQVANLQWTLSTFAVTALLGGTVPVALGLETLGTNANLALQSQTAELGFGMITVISGSTYGVIQIVESNPANFLSASNTVEYQFGAQKNGTPGTVPPSSVAIGDVNTAFKNPVVALSTVTVSAANLLTGGASGSVTLATLTGGGTTGSLTFVNGIITAFVAPT